MKLIRHLITLIIFIGVNNCIIYAQFQDSISLNKIRQIADDISSSKKKERKIFIIQSQKRLKALQEKEYAILSQLTPEALGKSTALSDEIQTKIAELQVFCLNPDSLLNFLPAGPYIERFDSLFYIFGFVKKTKIDLSILSEAQEEIANLRRQLGYSDMMQQWLQDRQEQWMELVNLNNNIIPNGLLNALKEWQVEINLYKEQISHWKETLKDSRKLEREVISQLNKLPAFRDFMSHNSELARLFGPVGGGGNTPSGQPIAGLQTIQSLTQQLQSQFGSSVLQGGNVLQQQLQTGMDQLNQSQTTSVEGLLRKLELPSTARREVSSDIISPAEKEKFKLKAIPFKQRFELGWNLQSAMRLKDFPAIRDVAINVGYKVNPRSIIGIGAAYKFALGESWKHIEWTHEGIGIRSFIDWRLTEANGKFLKGFWLTGGIELNYWSTIANNAQWKELAWRPAGIVGLSKIIPGKRSNGKLQVLFNYLDFNLAPEDRISIRWGKTF